MLKGQMLEIGWIVRLFLIVTLIFLVTVVNRTALNEMDVNMERNEALYRSQAASIHVQSSGEKRNVLTDFSQKLKKSDHDEFCKASISGFESDEPFYIQKTDSEEPTCEGWNLGFQTFPYTKAGQNQIHTFWVLWE